MMLDTEKSDEKHQTKLVSECSDFGYLSQTTPQESQSVVLDGNNSN